MNYFTDLFGGGNAAGGMRKPKMGQGMDLYGGQPSMNLGLLMPSNQFANPDTGTGMMPPASFGEMPTGGMDMQSAFNAMKLLDMANQQPQMQQFQLPSGSSQSYEQLMKMYGMNGLLG